MNKAYTYSELFNNFELLSSFKKKDEITLECTICKNIFTSKKNLIYESKRYGTLSITCSRQCYRLFAGYCKNIECSNCNKFFLKKSSQIKFGKNNFCSKSCSATFNNKNKKYGTRRSKLEIWLEERLKIKYGDYFFEFNNKNIINSEIDIYSPRLNLGFELNGIFHYEPIFSNEKLNQIKNNDERKFQACINKGIELCIIDTSSLKYFKPDNAQKYLDIICKIIDDKLQREGDSNPR